MLSPGAACTLLTVPSVSLTLKVSAELAGAPVADFLTEAACAEGATVPATCEHAAAKRRRVSKSFIFSCAASA
jgi:hypothetical protein